MRIIAAATVVVFPFSARGGAREFSLADFVRRSAVLCELCGARLAIVKSTGRLGDQIDVATKSDMTQDFGSGGKCPEAALISWL